MRIDDCSRIEKPTRLDEVMAVFDRALKKVAESCEIAQKELTRPLTPVEKEERETWKDGGLSL